VGSPPTSSLSASARRKSGATFVEHHPRRVVRGPRARGLKADQSNLAAILRIPRTATGPPAARHPRTDARAVKDGDRAFRSAGMTRSAAGHPRLKAVTADGHLPSRDERAAEVACPLVGRRPLAPAGTRTQRASVADSTMDPWGHERFAVAFAARRNDPVEATVGGLVATRPDYLMRVFVRPVFTEAFRHLRLLGRIRRLA
jgi:hypothetical protein